MQARGFGLEADLRQCGEPNTWQAPAVVVPGPLLPLGFDEAPRRSIPEADARAWLQHNDRQAVDYCSRTDVDTPPIFSAQ